MKTQQSDNLIDRKSIEIKKITFSKIDFVYVCIGNCADMENFGISLTRADSFNGIGLTNSFSVAQLGHRFESRQGESFFSSIIFLERTFEKTY